MRVRKFFCLALVALMVLAAVPAMASPTYQLWGIPFGCDKATFIAKVRDEQGIEFEGDSTTIYSRAGQNIKVYGYPAKIRATFINGLYEVAIEFEEIANDKMSKEDVVAEAIKRLRTICESMAAQSGGMTGGHFRTGSKDIGTISAEELTEYSFPVVGGTPDYDILARAALAEQMTLIRIDFNNILITADIVANGSSGGKAKAFVSMWFWDQPTQEGFASDLSSYGRQQIG